MGAAVGGGVKVGYGVKLGAPVSVGAGLGDAALDAALLGPGEGLTSSEPASPGASDVPTAGGVAPAPLSDELSEAEAAGVFPGDADALLGPDRFMPTLTPMIRRMKPITEMPQPETMPGSPRPSRRKNPGSAGSRSSSQSYLGRSAGVNDGTCDVHGIGAGVGTLAAADAALAAAVVAVLPAKLGMPTARPGALAAAAAAAPAEAASMRGLKLVTGAGDAGMRNGVATAGAAGAAGAAAVAAFASQARPRARQSCVGNAAVPALFSASRSAAAVGGRRASSEAIPTSTSRRTGGGTGFSGATAPAGSVVMTSWATSGGDPVTDSAKTAVAA